MIVLLCWKKVTFLPQTVQYLKARYLPALWGSLIPNTLESIHLQHTSTKFKLTGRTELLKAVRNYFDTRAGNKNWWLTSRASIARGNNQLPKDKPPERFCSCILPPFISISPRVLNKACIMLSFPVIIWRKCFHFQLKGGEKHSAVL